MEKYNNIFNRDFYPTPNSVIELMAIDFRGEILLEPQAGKGNIIDYAKEHGVKDVSFCEINKDLAEICKSKARFIKSNFLEVTAEEISHISLIVMNPPFSDCIKHIRHAWEIAPEGCQIVTLCNQDTVYRFRYDYTDLYRIIEDYGQEIELGNCFNQGAERKTDVNICCIKLFKPIYNTNTNFEGFYMDSEPEQRADISGVVKYNEIQALVNNYIGAMKLYDSFDIINSQMKSLCSSVGMDEGFTYKVSYNDSVSTKQDFSKELQRKSWVYIFGKMNLQKYMTSGVMKDINRFVEQQSNIPFTVKNVYRMFEVIVGTSEASFNRALVEAVDNFTMYEHENRYNIEGWKTNSGYMLNKKFIVPYVFDVSRGKLKVSYSTRYEKISDLEKVLCNLTGSDYNDIRSLSEMCHQFEGLEPNRWYCNSFFEVKGFKKGTAHFKFQNEEHWELLNRKYAEIKGYTLFEGKEQTKYQDKQTGRDKQEKSKPNEQFMPSINYLKIVS